MSNISEILINQRIRNRIIEVLELASSFEAQLEYQSNAPTVWVANEVINQWEDWVRDPRDPSFCPPVFTPEEQEAIASFYRVWDDVCENTPDPLPHLEELQKTESWERLRLAAKTALLVFQKRGRMSDEEENI